MQTLFRYNWQVRDEWFNWCKQLSPDELSQHRTGGVGSILRTLLHVVDVEQAWINGLQGKPEFHYRYEDYTSLDAIQELSDTCRPNIEKFVQNWSGELEGNTFYKFTYGEVLRQVIVHEIHHMGQLSIWAREIGREPITANLIMRGLYD